MLTNREQIVLLCHHVMAIAADALKISVCGFKPTQQAAKAPAAAKRLVEPTSHRP